MHNMQYIDSCNSISKVI